jgi:hypothetical protein
MWLAIVVALAHTRQAFRSAARGAKNGGGPGSLLTFLDVRPAGPSSGSGDSFAANARSMLPFPFRPSRIRLAPWSQHTLND